MSLSKYENNASSCWAELHPINWLNVVEVIEKFLLWCIKLYYIVEGGKLHLGRIKGYCLIMTFFFSFGLIILKSFIYT